MVHDLARARRLARVLVSDIVAYRGDDIRLGLEKDDLFERVGPELVRARGYFRRQLDPGLDGRRCERIFDHAIVDVLVYAHRRVPSWIW